MGEPVDECLRAAGCPAKLCEDARRLQAGGYAQELLPQLAQRRLQLLSELRQTDERLACLDRAIGAIRSQTPAKERP